MKRILAAAAAAVLALTFPGGALAAERNGFSLTAEGTEIVVEYQSGQPSSAIASFLILPPQAYDLNLSAADSDEVAGAAVYFDQITAGQDGLYRFRADVGSDGISGRYRVVAAVGGRSEEATVLYLKAGEDVAGVIARVNAAKDHTEADQALSGNKYLLDINVTYDSKAYQDYSEEILTEFLRRRGTGFADEAALKTAFDMAGMYVFANHSADAAALYQFSQEGMSLQGYGLSEQYQEDYQTYGARAYSILIEIRKEKSGGRFSDEADFLQSYREALGVCVINDSSIRSEMTKALKQYEPILKLGLDGGYADVDPVAVAKALTGRNFQTRTQLKAAFDQAVKDAAGGGSTSSGSSTGTGGGGGGGNRGGFGAGVTGNGDFAIDKAEPESKGEKPEGFTDLAGAEWAAESIQRLTEAGVVNGYPDNTFRPFQNVTREEFVKMLVLASGVQVSGGDTNFADVDPAEWHAPYISAAVRSGLVYGVAGDRFGVGELLTREDMAVLVSRVLESRGAADEGGAIPVFGDEAGIADYALEPVFRLQRLGIINGDEMGMFRPKEASDRAQTAKVIAGMMEHLSK